jgi:protein SCO1
MVAAYGAIVILAPIEDQRCKRGSMFMSQAIALTAATVVVVGLGATFAVTQLVGNPTFEQCSGSSVAGGDIGGPFTLLDKSGATVTDIDVITEPTLIYFGYSFCPDVCPIDMARNSVVVDILAEQGVSATPMFISIDPERDTPEIVGDYAFNFHDKAIGLTGSAEQVAAASKAYRTFYQKQEGDPDYYLMQHTTFSYLTLPEHGFVEFFRQNESPEKIAESVACFAAAS